MIKHVFSLFLLLALLVALTPQALAVSAESVEFMNFTSGLLLYSPINKTYSSNVLALNLTARAGLGTQCKITYNIDNQHRGILPWVPVKPNEFHILNRVKTNLTLPELTYGTHNLTIQVEWALRNRPEGISMFPFLPECDNVTHFTATWSDTIQFTIKPDQQIPEFLTAIILSLAAALIILTIWRRKLLTIKQ